MHSILFPTSHIFDMANPQPEDFDIKNLDFYLARLAKQNRYNGADSGANPISVKVHIELCAHIAYYLVHQTEDYDHWDSDRKALAIVDCYIHDLAEAFTGDVCTPIKKLIREQTSILDDIEDRWLKVIQEGLGIPVFLGDDKKSPEQIEREAFIKMVDNMAMLYEVLEFFPDSYESLSGFKFNDDPVKWHVLKNKVGQYRNYLWQLKSQKK